MKKECSTCKKQIHMLSWENECYSCRKNRMREKLKAQLVSGEVTSTEHESDVICPWCGENDSGCSDDEDMWVEGTLDTWKLMLQTLQEIRKLTPIPAYIDQWIECPECGAVHDPDPEPPEFVLGSDGYYIWIGPSSCSSCGQALDLTALNVPDKDSTFGLPDVAVDLLRGMGMLGDKDEPLHWPMNPDAKNDERSKPAEFISNYNIEFCDDHIKLYAKPPKPTEDSTP